MEHDSRHPKSAEEHYGRHIFDRRQHRGGRVFGYFVVMIIMNAMLAVYTIYMLGYSLAFDWSVMGSGTMKAVLEGALQIFLFLSPVILTLILNRLLYRVFRGRGRFPRGVWLLALFMVIIVQAAVIAFVFGYGFVDGTNGLNIEQISSQPLS